MIVKPNFEKISKEVKEILRQNIDLIRIRTLEEARKRGWTRIGIDGWLVALIGGYTRAARYWETRNRALAGKYARLVELLRGERKIFKRYLRELSDLSKEEITKENLHRIKKDLLRIKRRERNRIDKLRDYVLKEYPEKERFLNGLDWYFNLLSKAFERINWLIRVEAKPWRLSMVWMFYATDIKRYTPEPFAELRVFCITRYPERWRRWMFRGKLYELTKIFASIGYAWHQKQIYLGDEAGVPISAKIIGIERRQIDWDEAEATLESTGLPKREQKEETLYRYAAFFRKRKAEKVPEGVLRLVGFLLKGSEETRPWIYKEYNERDIRNLERRPEVRERIERWMAWLKKARRKEVWVVGKVFTLGE